MSTLRMGSLVVTLILFYTHALANHPPAPPDKETICHKPGTTAQKTLTLPHQAAEKHIEEHGDTPGACIDSSSIVCPCFTDLSQVGFTGQATCNISEGGTEIVDASSSFLLAQAGASPSFSACRLAIGDTEIQKLGISLEEGLACNAEISKFCATLSQP